VQARQAALGGQLGEAHRLEAALGVAADLLGRELRVGQSRQLQRDDPIRVGAGPLLEMQSFQARNTARPSSGSSFFQNTVPENPAISDGKFSDAQMPEVHVGDPGVDIPTAGAFRRTARPCSILFGRPMTALSPMLGIRVLVAPHLAAVVSTIWAPGRQALRAGGRRTCRVA
jgi:hypothetical protein